MTWIVQTRQVALTGGQTALEPLKFLGMDTQPTNQEASVPTPTHTLNVRGQQVRTRTPRRFVVVSVRPRPVTTDRGTFVEFAHVGLRTDNLSTARTRVRNNFSGPGAFCVVVDTVTGEEV